MILKRSCLYVDWYKRMPSCFSNGQECSATYLPCSYVDSYDSEKIFLLCRLVQFQKDFTYLDMYDFKKILLVCKLVQFQKDLLW
jgi:hypothetical protein